MSNTLEGHGEVGKREQPFTHLKHLRTVGYDAHKLAILAKAMALGGGDQANDGPDAEENLYVPAGYTYLGQFVDHDLTFDTTSTLAPEDGTEASNLRTPRFDLDCLYGNGPEDQPYMYDADGATLLWGGQGPDTPINKPYDLLRSRNGRAIIGDKRNDENSIVNQIQYAFVQFHNHVVLELKAPPHNLVGKALFEKARREVRWAYQRVLLDDFLPRIIALPVLEAFLSAWKRDRASAYLWYRDEAEPAEPGQTPRNKRSNLPREFVVAAYRFGHSGVRTGYRLSGRPGADMRNEHGFRANIFVAGSDDPADSLVGFDPLPANHVIDDWARFFPFSDPAPGHGWPANLGPGAKFEDGGDGTRRLQFAYKIDTTLVDPLADLPPKIAPASDVPPSVGAEFVPGPPPPENRPAGPSLALLNLLRGSRYLVQSGQAFAADLPKADRLPAEFLRVRQTVADGDGESFTYTHISDLQDASGQAIGSAFDDDTPLWFYILAEAQRPMVQLWLDRKADLKEHDLLGLDEQGKPTTADRPGPAAGTQLGPVGGRMVAEVFYGLMDSDSESVLRQAPEGWQPIWGGHGPATMADLLTYAHRPISELPRPV